MARGVSYSPISRVNRDSPNTSAASSADVRFMQVSAVAMMEPLRLALNEEWEHRSYAERDLAVLEARG